MRIAHIGPPLARQGGPGGYLLQLRDAARLAGAHDTLVLPPDAIAAAAPVARPPGRFREALLHAARIVRGRPSLYRPDRRSLEASHGHVERVVRDTLPTFVDAARASLEAAAASDADAYFCHDTAVAEHLLDARTDGRPVWLMLHSPMPLAMYLTWNWGVPEWRWQDVAALPDVARWSDWEVGVWERVDRLLVPCREAFDEIVRIVPPAARLASKISCLRSGASAGPRHAPQPAARASFGLPADRPVVLFIGNGQPYRGLDTLLDAATRLGRSDPDGVVAVAGPPVATLPWHRRVIRLGHVRDVSALLPAVDFVVNVNRFSLFDLSTIEALEAGRPLLVHLTGGNRTFVELGAGAITVDDLEPATLVEALKTCFAMPAADRDALAARSRVCYQRHLSLERFWENHRRFYEDARLACPEVAG